MTAVSLQRFTMHIILRAAAVAACLVTLAACSQDPTTKACAEPARLRFEPMGKFTRSETGFTQGLEVRDGKLYESTGRIGGTTKLNTISFTGDVTRLADRGLSGSG